MKISSIAILLLATSFNAVACGPYPPIIPTPKFFTSNWDGLLSRDFYKQENLRLWQQLTSNRIPLKDIEQVVYEDDGELLNQIVYGYTPIRTDNLFYVYLQNTTDYELADFLCTAKNLEKRRNEINSPWYYPSSRDTYDEVGDFQTIINICNSYKGTRIKDRYALQGVRALFASRCYDECIAYFDKAFQGFADCNLFKRMAMGYVAGCWSQLGNIDMSNEYFARSGDFYSIKSDDPITFMAEHNPDNPEMLSYIQTLANDSAKFCAIKSVAEHLLKQKVLENRGDWEFALAYMYGEYYSNYHMASQHIHRALQNKFSSDDLHDHARAYRIKMDAENGNLSSLLADMKWLESKTDMLSPDAKEWSRMIQNIVYSSLVPKLWNKGDYTTAILLCSYADNMLSSKQHHLEVGANGWFVFGPDAIKTQTIAEMRKDEQQWNPIDYRSLSFQLMGSLSSDQLISVKQGIKTDTKLYAFLKRYARTDADYLNEIIGTLALREENYQRAIRYFANVSEEYIRTMNIYSYLNRDPFYAYPNRWVKYDYSDWEYEYESQTIKKPLQESQRVKYQFAKKMLDLKNQIKYGKNNDIRGMARLKYAIGRRNSFEECWALTQYWRGEYVGLFEPWLDYWSKDNYVEAYGFLYDYKTTIGHKKTEEIYQTEIKEALAMLQTDEAKAEAEYILGNLRTIIKHYGNTTTAKNIKISCDNWHTWL